MINLLKSVFIFCCSIHLHCCSYTGCIYLEGFYTSQRIAVFFLEDRAIHTYDLWHSRETNNTFLNGNTHTGSDHSEINFLEKRNTYIKYKYTPIHGQNGFSKGVLRFMLVFVLHIDYIRVPLGPVIYSVFDIAMAPSE